MKPALILIAAMPLVAGELERFTDTTLNYTQRNSACVGLRGDKSDEVREAMRSALTNISLQACAAANLRVLGDTESLNAALTGPDSSARAVAARELGAMGDHEAIPLLRKAAEDKDLLVASNAVEGLARFEDHASAPALREIALSGGMLTSLALNTLIEWHDPEVLDIARKVAARTDPGDQLTGIRVLAQQGNKADLSRLKELAKDDAPLNATARGFGLMPAISVARAATTAISAITAR